MIFHVGKGSWGWKPNIGGHVASQMSGKLAQIVLSNNDVERGETTSAKILCVCGVGSQPFPRVSNYYQNSFELRKQCGLSFFFDFGCFVLT